MELLQLKYFKTVAQFGKINAAAAELFISPPALSAAISRLEKDLGMELFERSRNRIMLNEQGKIFLGYVNRVLANLDCAKVDMRYSLEDRAKNIQIAITASNLWLELFDAYCVVRPDVTVSASTVATNRISDMDMLNRYAFLLAEGDDLHQNNLDSTLLFVDRPYVMLHKSHPLAQKGEVSLHDLLNENLILPMPEQSLNQRLRDAFAEANVPIKNASEYAHGICRYLVTRGRGISFTTQHAMTPDTQIQYVKLREQVCWEQRMYWHRERVFSRDEQVFKEFVVRFFQEQNYQPMYHYESYLFDIDN